MMTRTTKAATVLALAGALAVTAATPSFARNGRIGAGIAGFAIGAMVGAAAASSNRGSYYYAGEPYAYQPSYGYEPGYAYQPGYAYRPGPVYEPGSAYEPLDGYRRAWR